LAHLIENLWRAARSAFRSAKDLFCIKASCRVIVPSLGNGVAESERAKLFTPGRQA
jgi:hypothetical protein